MSEWVIGRNPILELLRADRRRVHKIHVARGSEERGALARLLALAHERKIPVSRVAHEDFNTVQGNHQGVMAEVTPYPYMTVEDILDIAQTKGELPWILILDGIQDPQNLGALLRSAEAVGVHGVVVPYRGSSGITPAVVRASAGASEYLFVTRANLAQAIDKLKKADVWVAGLENSAQAVLLEEVDLPDSLALVVGSEGQGMRRLVRESCDYLIRIPMRGWVESLNASVAGAIALYAIWRQHGYVGAHTPGAERRG
ncbi:MAG: 23S rRNA (guanosine(2251)-2'-O)-methyltransferase RlmB [Anaerolineales bacterium]|nr:23S rRNA (guanosine(2251)-2'-O)-methyltransferase RlmB [Anaerolineales bacterium]